MAKKLNTVTGFDSLMTKLDQYQKSMKVIEKNAIAVGVHEDAGKHDNSDLSIAEIATVNEYGTTIRHPGGTKYATIFGQTRFISNQSSLVPAGVTKAHDIVIPERSFLRSAMKENNKKYSKFIFKLIRRVTKATFKGMKHTAKEDMGKLGVMAVNDVKNKMVSLKTPANAKSTIAKKKTSNPLIASGQTVNSIKWKYLKEKVTKADD